MTTVDTLKDILLTLVECFEPTSPPTFIGDDGTVVTVPAEVEDVIDRALRAIDEEDSEDNDVPF